MALKVIGAGFGRTGTASMKAALEQLGYVKTHHMFEVLASKRQQELWLDIVDGKQPDWDAVFDGYPASVDFPSAAYWRELAAHYPDAKIVLTTRSADSWWKSARATIIEIGTATPKWARRRLPEPRRIDRIVNGAIWDPLFDGRQFEEDHAKRVFEAHNEAVIASLPSERLLVFEVKQGWEPLCRFLGEPVPDTPFPHVNDTAQFKRMIRNIKLAFGAIHVAGFALLAGAAWFAFG